MKLIYRITIRLALAILPVMLIWGCIFYFSTMRALHEETDESLDYFAENVVDRFLSGQELPDSLSSTIMYNIIPVSESFANTIPHIRYYDGLQYFPGRGRDEARILTIVFRNSNEDYYILKSYTNTIERSELLKPFLLWTALLYVAMMAIIIIVTLIVFYRNLKPLYKLLAWLDDFKAGQTNPELDNDTGITEFRKLNDSVRDALDRYEDAYRLQKEFIGNASHELQTPLAVIGNRIEWLLDNTDPSEEQARELIDIQRSVSDAVRLNRTLLLLTKIENNQFPETVEVDIVKTVKRSLDIFSEIYGQKQLQCSYAGPEGMKVRMNAYLAASLVDNLLKNAYIYTAAHGEIRVEVSTGMLKVSNSGDVPLDENHIFERFYKKDAAKGASGLGLAIVGAIQKSCNLQVKYNFSGKMHVFSVKWPEF